MGLRTNPEVIGSVGGEAGKTVGEDSGGGWAEGGEEA